MGGGKGGANYLFISQLIEHLAITILQEYQTDHLKGVKLSSK